MNLSRRLFLGSAATAACLSKSLMAIPTEAPLVGTARVKFGVLSDVHLDHPGDEDTFLKALTYFRDAGVDGVIIAGDIANTGRVVQLKRSADSFYKVFPNGKAPDGRRVEQLFVLGNHCVDGWTWGADQKKRADPAYRAQCIGPDRAKAWQQCFNEEFHGVWMKDVKGYKVIGAHWGSFNEVEPFFKAHAAELGKDKPFFFVMHPHAKNSCIGSWAWGNTDQLNKVFAQYPNCIVLSGHSHYTLTDERTVWQGAFTAVNTSSLKYSSVDYNLRDNMPGNGWGYRKFQAGQVTPRLPTGDGRQGMVFTVTDDALRICRREFVYGQSLGDDWVLPLKADPNGPMNFKKRAAARKAPVFPSDAKLDLTDVLTAKKVPCVRVGIPSVVVDRTSRVFDYEVQPVLVEDDVELPLRAKRVMAADYYLPVSKAGRISECWFAKSDFPPQAHVYFEVRPVDCFGLKGAPIRSAVKAF